MSWIKKKFSENIMFLKFIMVGLLNTLVGLGTIFVLFNILQLNYWVSTSLGNILGIICSYFLNKGFTFQSKKSTYKTIWKFILVSFTCYIFSYYLGHLFIVLIDDTFSIEKSNLFENASILIASVIYTISNYFGHKYYTFAK